MPQTLEKYAEFLDERGELWPAGPVPIPYPKVAPYVKTLPDVRCVIWSGYGTLMVIDGGELALVNPDPVMRRVAFDKTIHEFKMWHSMSRRRGEPSSHMIAMFEEILGAIKITLSTVRGAEVRVEQVWERILGRLFQKEYYYDTALYGELAEFSRKIGYYFLRSSQGVAFWPNELHVVRELTSRKISQGIFGNGQCVSPIHLLLGLRQQGIFADLAECFAKELCLWSFETGVRVETPGAMDLLVKTLVARQIEPASVLFVGTHAERDIANANRRGMKTALLLADRPSCKVKQRQLESRASRPDLLLTAFDQILDVVQPR